MIALPCYLFTDPLPAPCNICLTPVVKKEVDLIKLSHLPNDTSLLIAVPVTFNLPIGTYQVKATGHYEESMDFDGEVNRAPGPFSNFEFGTVYPGNPLTSCSDLIEGAQWINSFFGKNLRIPDCGALPPAGMNGYSSNSAGVGQFDSLGNGPCFFVNNPAMLLYVAPRYALGNEIFAYETGIATRYTGQLHIQFIQLCDQLLPTATPVDSPSPTFTRTPASACVVSILRPPDGTAGIPHTVLATCTLVTVTTPTTTPTQISTSTMTMTPTPVCQACSNGVPRLAQGSPAPWAAVQVDSTSGSKETIAWIGCFLTCYAMIDPKHRTPAVLNTLFDSNGDFDSGGAFSNAADAASLIGFNYDREDLTGSAAEDLISKNVCAANTFVVAMLDLPHFVLVTGETFDVTTQTCRFTIDDPAHTNHTFLDQYTITDGKALKSVRIFTKQ